MRAALGAIDDPVALVGDRPVAVDSLWSDCAAVGELRELQRRSHRASVVVVVVARRCGRPRPQRTVMSVVARPRSWLLTQASDAEPEATVVVEIAERLVAVAGARRDRRNTPQDGTASRCQRGRGRIAGMRAAVVLIDTPGTVAGAPVLATLIAGCCATGAGRRSWKSMTFGCRGWPGGAVGAAGRRAVRAAVHRGAGGVSITRADAERAGGRRLSSWPRRCRLSDRGPARRCPTAQTMPTTFLVEGRVALTVPANWPTQRVVAGPGSARVQVTSPSDPEVALHVTQSPVAGETLVARLSG